jgi:hypothetical protein
MSTDNIQALQQRLDELTLRSEVQAAERLLHVMQEGTDYWGFSDLSQPRVPPQNDALDRPLVRSHSMIRDQLEGRQAPLYETELDLARLRAKCRNLRTFSTAMLGAEMARRVYVLGGEWSYDVQLRDDDQPRSGLVAAAQRVVDRFLEANDWIGDLDCELFDQMSEDGDVLLALYPQGHGRVRADLKVADMVKAPTSVGVRQLNEWLGTPDAVWHFGVHVPWQPILKCHDYGDPLGYFVTYDDASAEWDYLPRYPQVGSEFEDTRCGTLVKANVRRRAARGWSDYAPLLPYLEAFHKLWQGTTTGATIQANIAYILEGATGAGRSAMSKAPMKNLLQQYIENQASVVQAGQGSDRQYTPPGTIIKTSAGQKYHAAPLGSPNSDVFLSVAQFCLRLIGTRWVMPEFMISGDASNANFASTTVATSPFVKARLEEQSRLKQVFRRVVMKVLRMAYLDGVFDGLSSSWQDIERSLWIDIAAPDISTRNKVEEVQSNEVLFRNGILDRRTWAAMANLDPDMVVAADAESSVVTTGMDVVDVEPVVDTSADTEASTAVGAVDVQQMGLNGAQVSSLLAILQLVTTQQLPLETGRQTIVAAFPFMSAADVDRIMRPLVGYEPARATESVWTGYP